jgi:glycosyltransferase involved in cell wall biosynthesis
MPDPDPRPRLAWFSPLAPSRSGVAAVTADLVPALRRSYDIDVFIAEAEQARPTGVRSAHDFVWLDRQSPYDLHVYQLGNSSAHDYIWPYLFRYPGLTVLHDARIHHARAASLLRARRAQDYRTEFAANHPDVSADVAELAVAGFDTHLYYYWPMTRLVAARSKLVAVHADREAARLRQEAPGAAVETIRLGHGGRIPDAEEARRRTRDRYGIPDDAVVFGCFGGLSPEKRLPAIAAAFAATRAHHPSLRLLLAGAVPAHYDLRAELERCGIAASTIVTGYLEQDDELKAHVAACDVALNLRWPTAREISGPWLRCLAEGVPTVITQLAHLVHVPALDPRTWLPTAGPPGTAVDPAAPPVCVAIDILDEDHSLRAAMRRLVRDTGLRRTLGAAGRAWWNAHHSLERMVEDYRRVIPLAMARPVPAASLPPHLLDRGRGTLERLLAPFGLPDPLS